MKLLILAFVLVGSLTIVRANSSEAPTNSEATFTTSEVGPTTVIISGGKAQYFDDGGKCTINLDNGDVYGPDC